MDFVKDKYTENITRLTFIAEREIFLGEDSSDSILTKKVNFCLKMKLFILYYRIVFKSNNLE